MAQDPVICGGGSSVESIPDALVVGGCSHRLCGSYYKHSEFHGKPAYKSVAQVNDLDAVIFFFDERNGPHEAGWWFSPKVGGDEVWAYNSDVKTAYPPRIGWKACATGMTDLDFTVEPGELARGCDAASHDNTDMITKSLARTDTDAKNFQETTQDIKPVPDDRPCPICLEDEMIDRVVCPCPGQHAFCRDCLSSARCLSCPFCRDSSDKVAMFLFRISQPATDQEGWMLTQITPAVSHGMLCIVEVLVDMRCPIDKHDSDGMTPLMHAVSNGRVEIARCLLGAGANVEARVLENSIVVCTQQNAEHAAPHPSIDLIVFDLVGEYDEHDTNLGRPVYRKLEADNIDAASSEIFLYYWVYEEWGMQGWWFSKQLGGQEILSHVQSDSMAPPETGWQIRGVDVREAMKVHAKTDGDTPLHMAVAASDGNMLRCLLEGRADVDAVVEGETALHIAAADDAVDIVQLLLQARANTSMSATEDGYTALHVAAEAGHEKVAQLLLEARSDVNVTAWEGDTAMHVACRYSASMQLPIVDVLLQYSPDLTALSRVGCSHGGYGEGYTVLHMCISSFQESVVQRLVDARADIESRISRYSSLVSLPLRHEPLLREGWLVFLAHSVQFWTTVEDRNNWVIELPAGHPCRVLRVSAGKECVEVLALAGRSGSGVKIAEGTVLAVSPASLVPALNASPAQIYERLRVGETVRMVTMFPSERISPELRTDPHDGLTYTKEEFLEYYQSEWEWDAAERFQESVLPGDAGVIVEDLGADGAFEVCIEGARGRSRCFIRAQKEEIVRDVGLTALQMAAFLGHSEMVKTFINAGAELNAGPQTALHLSAERGRRNVIEILLQARADPHIASSGGQKALTMTAACGHHEVAKQLYDAMTTAIYATPQVVDDVGTAAAIACEQGHADIASFLNSQWLSDVHKLHNDLHIRICVSDLTCDHSPVVEKSEMITQRLREHILEKLTESCRYARARGHEQSADETQEFVDFVKLHLGSASKPSLLDDIGKWQIGSYEGNTFNSQAASSSPSAVVSHLSTRAQYPGDSSQGIRASHHAKRMVEDEGDRHDGEEGSACKAQRLE